jgi:REP element-mobilizing transposase RayT
MLTAMTRMPRDEGFGAIHHVVAQGNGRRPNVEDDRDRVAFVNRFERIVRELRWATVTSCLMDTHHHVVLQTAEPNLGLGMKRLQGGHARWFNVRHGRDGNLFRHRFWSRRIRDDGWLLRACVYVVVNPVAAGVCAHPREWRWCSYARIAGGSPDSFAPGEELLLGMLGDSPLEARRRYVELVDVGVEIAGARHEPDGASLWRSLGRITALGGEQVSG